MQIFGVGRGHLIETSDSEINIINNIHEMKFFNERGSYKFDVWIFAWSG